MAEPWIRVHGALIDRPVVMRLAEATRISTHEAVGVLVTFWGNVATHATNGCVAACTDALLEKWAQWPRKRGAFAAWLRETHLDDEGRVREWDEYAGKLEARRAAERDRIANVRKMLRERTANGTQDVAQRTANGTHDVRKVLQPARANGTERNGTERRTRSKASTGREAPLPPDSLDVAAHWTARVGASPAATVHRALGVFLAAHGPTAVKAAIDVYASDDEGPGPGKPRKLAWFAEEYMRWHGIAQTPLSLNGELTARGRRIMRSES